METLASAREGAIRAERERIRAIFSSEGGRNNYEAALVFALQTDVPADAAISALTKMPAAAQPRRTNMFNAPPSISLGPDGGDPSSASSYDKGRERMARALGKTL